MKQCIFAFALACSVTAECQSIDTLINTGKYTLHVKVIPGKGTPILFEAGGGNDGNIWNGITPAVATVTGAPVITYDRPGLGKSGIDSSDMRIENDIASLEIALKQMGFGNDIMLVSHSLGGFYNSLFTALHPKSVKAIVLIDANLPCFFTEDQFQNMNASKGFRAMVETIKKNPIPGHVPVFDIVSDKTLFEGTQDADRWKACHLAFVNESPTRQGTTALGTGHYIFLQNGALVINSIVTMYANYIQPTHKAAILERGYAQAFLQSNEDRKKLMDYWHSENDINEWGYALLLKKDSANAIEVFKLNASLHPMSANVYDSLADGYENIGKKEEAIKNYRKALELDPKKNSALKALQRLIK